MNLQNSQSKERSLNLIKSTSPRLKIWEILKNRLWQNIGNYGLTIHWMMKITNLKSNNKTVKNKEPRKWKKHLRITSNSKNNQKAAVKSHRLNLKKMMKTLIGWNPMQLKNTRTVTLLWRLRVSSGKINKCTTFTAEETINFYFYRITLLCPTISMTLLDSDSMQTLH